jgi:hypothetical protein
VLIGGSDNAYAPWKYLAADDGQMPEGIDVDIANAITARLGLTYESQIATFDAIVSSRHPGRWVAVAILVVLAAGGAVHAGPDVCRRSCAALRNRIRAGAAATAPGPDDGPVIDSGSWRKSAE